MLGGHAPSHRSGFARRGSGKTISPGKDRRILRPIDAVTLRDLTETNRASVVGLRVDPGQERFVGSVAGALEEAVETPEGNPWYRAIYAGDEPVGFVMLSWNVAPDPPRIIGPWFLWKLIIDQRHQRRGYGRQAMRLVADLVRAAGATELLTSYAQGEGEPWPFYRSLGFRATGELDEEGEIILSLDLSTRRQSEGPLPLF